jgi:hypothetical protein
MREICVIHKKKYLPQKGKTGEMITPQPITTVKYRTENWGDGEHEKIISPFEST